MHSLTIVSEDAKYILVWKPTGRASSRGSSFSLLDVVKEQNNFLRIEQKKVFGPNDEYGLLNRLDNETTGIVVFAKSHEAKAHYQKLQSEGNITKIYYTTVYGQISGDFGWIQTPLYHHRDDPSRMTTDPDKGRGQAQEVTTYREKIVPSSQLLDPRNYDLGSRNTLVKVQITAGCRHQIRCHLASIGHPIIGDSLYTGGFWKKYCKKRNISLSSSLDLVSAGIHIV